MGTRRYRLAILASHPVQYHAPLYRMLTLHPAVDLTVFYGSDWGAAAYHDSGFGRKIQWDVDLLQGYRHRFLRNFSCFPSPHRFWGLFSPEILWRLMRDRYDALLIHGYSHASSWLGVAGARLSRTPCLFRGETVFVPEGTSFRKAVKTPTLRWFFHQMAGCLAVGSKSKTFFQAYGVPESKIGWSPYSIDQAAFAQAVSQARSRRADLKRNLELPEELPVILFVGKLIPRKHPLDLLKAATRLKKQAVLVYVGDGALRKTLETFIRQHNLSCVRLVGFKNQTELPAYYSIADLFVLPSEYEPWGIVINEAAAAGLPIVTTTGVAAAADLVKPGQNGFLYKPGDTHTLCELLGRLVDSPPLRSQMGRCSKELMNHWGLEASVAGIVKEIERCAS